MEKVRTTIYVDNDSYKKFKIQSIEMGKSMNERINDFIKKEASNKKKDDLNE